MPSSMSSTVINPLLQPCMLGSFELSNRMAVAPMTRTRATQDRIPTPLMATYYAQRASAGLIISECVAVSEDSAGIIRSPGLYNSEQVTAWRVITDAVHSHGGKIFCQLWHGGRCSHVSLQPGGEAPVAPSAVAAEGLIFTPEGRVPYSVPRALEPVEIANIVARFASATQMAREAGFDGVELHAAYGYLPDQFLQDGSNRRTDSYGGPIENRARFLFELVDAMSEAWQPGRLGVKLSPSNTSYGIRHSNTLETFGYAIRGLSERGILYLHLMEPDRSDFDTGLVQVPNVIETFGPIFAGPIIANGGFDAQKATAVIVAGRATVVSFGKLFLANPDLPARFAAEAALNAPDYATFYGEGSKGYTDYPTIIQASQQIGSTNGIG